MSAPVDDLIARCQRHRDSQSKESNLREEFVSHLRRVFPTSDDQKWIDHYIEGGETTQKGIAQGGRSVVRFVDTLVRATVLEYEADIRDRTTYEHGKEQLKEYTANLLCTGTPVAQARAVLSDFVQWEVYSVSCSNTGLAKDTRPEHIEFSIVEQFDTTYGASTRGEQFKDFLRAHLAREGSRAINAEHLVTDLGLKSRLFAQYADALKSTVTDARQNDPSVKLATDLWSRFIDHLERGSGNFRVKHYAAELYFCLVARLLSANVLSAKALRSDDAETRSILEGTFFSNHFRLSNFVEKDYFGWIALAPHVGVLSPIAQQIQRDLAAYDFSRLPNNEVFGLLIGQLGEDTERHLLGQENTPAWLARAVATSCLERLPEGTFPNFVDMCCGSGAIICEFLKSVMLRFPGVGIERLSQAVTGFDVDPLAVAFAKTTWVLTLATEIKASKTMVAIPIFHADSLFVATPTAKGMPRREAATEIDVDLDGEVVKLPAVLIQPEFRKVFDDIVDWAYDSAVQAVNAGQSAHVTEELAGNLLIASMKSHGVVLDPQVEESGKRGLHKLALRMSALATERRNGIWAFILKNTYRPSLLAGQFNGVISNPPWLALSKIGNNPYKALIKSRTDSYGLAPTGPSFLHLEIATTFLMYAADRYLARDGQIGVLLPGTLINGDHHEPFRQGAYQTSSRRVCLQIDELWDIPKETFKAPCVVLVGHKTQTPGSVTARVTKGFRCEEQGRREVGFSVHTLQSGRTAWSFSKSGGSTQGGDVEHLEPEQGADLMPRTAVCVMVLEETGTEWKVKTPRSTELGGHVVADSKKMKTANFSGFVAPTFIHGMLQSNGLIPFVFDRRLPTIAVPVVRKSNRALSFRSDEEIRADGLRQSAKRFAQIEQAYQDEIGKEFREYLNTRGKLLKQTFPSTGFLVLQGAGGSNTTAAVFALDKKYPNVLIDQTLYWYWTESIQAADYYVGVLNSQPLADRIEAFIPEGVLGKRHLHTLPWKVTPVFDPADANHAQTASLSAKLRGEVQTLISRLPQLEDPGKWIKTGRSQVRAWLADNPTMAELNRTATAVLGTV